MEEKLETLWATPDANVEEPEKTVANDYKIPRQSDDDLRKFVLGYCDNQLFTSCDIPSYGRDMERWSRDVSMVFIPVGLGVFKDVPQEEYANIGIVWEWYDKALPRAINGMPMFMSARTMHTEDWDRAKKAIIAEMERRKSISV